MMDSAIQLLNNWGLDLCMARVAIKNGGPKTALSVIVTSVLLFTLVKCVFICFYTYGN